MNKPDGAKEHFEVEDDMRMYFEGPDEPKLDEYVVAYVEFLKLPHEINVQIRDLHTSAASICSKCLTPFECSIDVSFAECEFLIDLPKWDIEPGEDVYYVNKNTNEIELEKVLRDEILLYFPAIPVCFEGCKGLCYKCGADLNKTDCKCNNIYGQTSSS